MNRIKVLCLLLTLLMFPVMSNSSVKIDLEDYINSFSWDKRIVLFIAKDIHFINETDDFFKLQGHRGAPFNSSDKYTIPLTKNEVWTLVILDL